MLIILFFPIIVSILLGFILLLSKKKQGVSKKILGVFFLLFSFSLFAISLNFLRSFLEPIQKYFQFVELLFYPAMLSLPVVVFLYIKSLIYYKKESIKKDVIIHFFIPIQSFLFNLTPIINGSIISALNEKLDYANFFTLRITFVLLNLYYLINAFTIFKQNSEKLKEEYSYKIGVQFKWMLFFILGYVAFILCFFLLSPKASPYVVYIPFLMVSFYLYFQRFNQNSIELQLNSDIEEEKKEASNILSIDKRLNIIEKVKDHIESKEAYLQHDLTIHDIAREIKVNSSYISNVLNQNLSTNFVTFINKYRIEKAKVILLDKNYEHYTIEAISELVGFKSKSSFNSAFKNLVKMTPSEFKKNKNIK
ncbi:helix-turn-helix domain-containing protein [Flavobacterium sp.]|uniref:helix-turn-helix domain-containing protein n=1 Tax=Flavobacterium sp. TaxID=239 RepID=UPI003526E7AD